MLPSLTGPLALNTVDVHAGQTQILHGVTLSLHPGELCALIGPSGAGKSTLIKVLLGLRKPSSGKVTLAGGPATAVPIGYVPQDDALHRSLTVQQTLDFAAELRLPQLSEEERAARIQEVVAQVGLAERLGVRVRRLSGGQRKRVSVALELLTRPPVLILDEPTSGLDPGLEARMMGLFSDLARQGHVVLVATHAMQSLKRCDALAVLVAGRVAYFGPPESSPDYFETLSYAGIFEVLQRHAPLVWGKKWQQSGERGRFLGRPAPRIEVRDSATSPKGPQPSEAPKPPSKPVQPSTPPPLSAEEQLARLKKEMGQ